MTCVDMKLSIGTLTDRLRREALRYFLENNVPFDEEKFMEKAKPFLEFISETAHTEAAEIVFDPSCCR